MNLAVSQLKALFATSMDKADLRDDLLSSQINSPRWDYRLLKKDLQASADPLNGGEVYAEFIAQSVCKLFGAMACTIELDGGVDIALTLSV